MHLRHGVLVKGPPPKSNNRKTPKVVTHRSQRTRVGSSSRRLDSLIQGVARICIHRSLGGLGDIIMATPIARGAKRKYPNCHLTFAVPIDYAGGDLAELLYYIPQIDEIIDYKLVVRDDYDAFSDITRAGLRYEKPYTTPKNRIDLFAEAAGIPLYGQTRPLYVMTEEEREWGQELVDKCAGGKKKIAIHLRSNDPKRTWPTQQVRDFLRLAYENGFHCFLFGWGDPIEDWMLRGTTPLFNYKIRHAAGILNACDVLVCPDSVMLHLGGALNMKTVSLFGSMPPACRINYYPNAIAVVNQKLPCIGCIYAPCDKDFYCMKSITPEAVLLAVKEKLSTNLIEARDIEISEAPIIAGAPIKKQLKTFNI